MWIKCASRVALLRRKWNVNPELDNLKKLRYTPRPHTAKLHTPFKASGLKKTCSRRSIVKLYTLFKTQDPESHLIPCAAAHTRIGWIWEFPFPLPSRANNAAQINKVNNEFQFRHRRPKLTLRGMGDAWHLCWMRRYAPRYRWPLKTRDFVWEIKYWDLRTINNVKSNFSFNEMN